MATEITAPEQQAEATKVTTVTLSLPAGTKETPQYLITSKMGKRERWFEKKRLTSFKKTGDGYEIVLPLRAVKDRGILAMAKAD